MQTFYLHYFLVIPRPHNGAKNRVLCSPPTFGEREKNSNNSRNLTIALYRCLLAPSHKAERWWTLWTLLKSYQHLIVERKIWTEILIGYRNYSKIQNFIKNQTFLIYVYWGERKTKFFLRVPVLNPGVRGMPDTGVIFLAQLKWKRFSFWKELPFASREISYQGFLACIFIYTYLLSWLP